jgi:hypothetical protein
VIRRTLRRNPPLLLLFLVTAAWIAWFATRIHVYFVMPDEARYVKQAIDIAASWQPLRPGDTDFQTYSQIQSALMAPLWGLFATPRAYQLTHLLNALLLASSVFPAYLLTLRVLGRRGWALAGAALVVLVPWTVMAGVMMTENSAYPLALWAYWGMQRCATGPGGWRDDLIALVCLAGAFFARTQLVVLAPVLFVVLLAQGLRYPVPDVTRPTRRLRSTISAHKLVFGVGAVVLLVFVVRTRAIIGNAPERVFSPGWDVFARETLAYIAIGVAMLPLALSIAWVIGTLVRPATPEQHAFAVIGGLSGVLLVVIVAGGSIYFTSGVNDRYLAYLVPLLMVGMIACLLEPRPWRLWIGVGTAFAAWVAFRAVLEEVGPTFVSPSAAWHFVLYGHAPGIGRYFGVTLTSPQLMAWWTIVACVLIALARSWRGRTTIAVVVTAVVGVYGFTETMYTRHKLEAIQPAANYADGRDWVDQTLPYGAKADAVLSLLGADQSSATATWWDLTFWNAKVNGTKYTQPAPTGWTEQAFPVEFTIDDETGAVANLGAGGYIVQGVADRRFGLRGAVAVGAPHNNLQILQVPQPVAAMWQWRGPDETGYVPPGGEGTVRVFGDGLGGKRAIAVVLGTPFGATGPSRYRISGAGQSVPGSVEIDQQAQPQVIVRDMPVSGHVDITIRAPSAKQGVQFYGAGIGAPLS